MFNAQNRIRQLMAERGWTIYRLAQESGLSQTTISNIFKRNNQPSLPTVNAICDACGITLAQFFTENDTANSPNAKSELDNSVTVYNVFCCLSGSTGIFFPKILPVKKNRRTPFQNTVIEIGRAHV